MIDAFRKEAVMQNIPMPGFVGKNGRVSIDPAWPSPRL